MSGGVGASGRGRAGREVRRDDVVEIRRGTEPDQRTVGVAAGQARRLLAQDTEQHRRAGRVGDVEERLHPVALAGVRDVSVGQERVDDREVLAQVADRPVEVDAVHAHHGLVARPDPETEAPPARRARGRGGLRHHQRMARPRRHDRDTELDLVRRRAGQRERHHRVEAERGSDPQAVEALILRAHRQRAHRVDAARLGEQQRDLHRGPGSMFGEPIGPAR